MKKLIENTGVVYPQTYVIETQHERTMWVGANGLVVQKRYAIKFPTQQAAEYFRLDMSTMPENYKVVPYAKVSRSRNTKDS